VTGRAVDLEGAFAEVAALPDADGTG